MKIEEIKALDLAGIEARTAEIRTEMDAEGADIAALTAEVDALVTRKAEIESSNAAFAALRNKVSAQAPTVENHIKETKAMAKMTMLEVRSLPAYCDAFAEYIKTGDDKAVRSIITENAGESVEGARIPVPVIAETEIQHAWDDMKILSRTHSTDLKGNVKVGVEVSGTDAEEHEEGTAAPAEEELTLKIVEMVPRTIKKWVTFSDEAVDMNGQAFVQYVYRELAYKIFKKAEDTVVADIVADVDKLGTEVAATLGVADFINAVATLSDEATDPVVIINKQSYAYYKALMLAANYAIDVFDNMTVLYNNTLTPVTSAEAKGNIGIVGDLKGFQTNFPNGKDVTYKFDDTSLAEKDLVKIVGRMPMGHAVIAPKRFAVLKAE